MTDDDRGRDVSELFLQWLRTDAKWGAYSAYAAFQAGHAAAMGALIPGLQRAQWELHRMCPPLGHSNACAAALDDLRQAGATPLESAPWV